MLHDLNKVPAGIIACAPTGSKYICNPPVLNTDEDYAVLVNNLTVYAQSLLDDGWDVLIAFDDYRPPNGGHRFFSARKGEMNLIVFDQKDGYDWMVKATELAKRFNLTDKADRVALFDAIRGGRVKPEPEPVPVFSDLPF